MHERGHVQARVRTWPLIYDHSATTQRCERGMCSVRDMPRCRVNEPAWRRSLGRAFQVPGNAISDPGRGVRVPPTLCVLALGSLADLDLSTDLSPLRPYMYAQPVGPSL